MFQTKFKEKLETRFMSNNSFFFFENCTVYKIMCKAEQESPQMIIRHMRFVCRILKATNTTMICSSNYCFYTATMIAPMRINITLYAH